MIQGLPLGSSNFKALRSHNEIYVDKTSLIFELANTRGKLFLARPRRFGKSLLISTFESLFKDGLKDFKGLAIEKYWTDKTYPVVRLDFSELKEFNTVAQFSTNFIEMLRLKFAAAGFTTEKNEPFLILKLSDWLSSLEPSSLVILVDEYDAPLTVCLDQPELFAGVRSLMSQFFLTLKANEGCQRFFFMTGITKFSNTSIFSAFNNLLDISLNPVFGTLLGYTDEEIQHYFKEYLDRAASRLNVDVSEVLTNLKANYDGFSFDMKASTHVYCPWSVLNFLAYPEMGYANYWYMSGGQPSVLMKYLLNHSLEKPISFNKEKLVRLSDLDATSQYNEINLDVLLTQAGYFSIRSVREDGYAVLGYPNQEVAISMAQLYSDELLKGKPLELAPEPSISEVLARGSCEDVIRIFNRVVGAIDYKRYPISDEASCRAYMQVLLMGAAMLPRVEVHNALGRSDMEVHVSKRHWIFEFKYAKNDNNVSELLDQAVEQIQNKQYGCSSSENEVIRVALVFSSKKRSFTAWKKL